MFNWNNTKKIDMKKMEHLAALASVAADAVSADQIAAANAELVEAGIEAVEFVQVGAMNTLTEQLNTATESATALETRATEAEGNLATANARIEALVAENAALRTPQTPAAEIVDEGSDKETEEELADNSPEAIQKLDLSMSNRILEAHGLK
jgi:hypothetical protein